MVLAERRAGSGCEMIYRPYGVESLSGVMIGLGDTLPGGGWAGALPGATTELYVHRRNGTTDHVSSREQAFQLLAGDRFEVRVGSAGGFGDPLERDAWDVATDVLGGRYPPEEAAAVYGVVLDHEGTLDMKATDRHERSTPSKPAGGCEDSIAAHRAVRAASGHPSSRGPSALPRNPPIRLLCGERIERSHSRRVPCPLDCWMRGH